MTLWKRSINLQQFLTRGLITSTRRSFLPPNALLHKFLLPSMDQNAERTAFVDYVTKETLTHGQCGELFGKIANQMVEWGVKPGDHVAISSFNHLLYFPLQLGIIAAGGRAALCNPAYVGRELEQLYKTSDVTRVIGHPNNSDAVNTATKSLNLPDPLDISTIQQDCRSFSSELPSDIPMDIHDTCSLFFSSGTTGFPKAVEFTHNNYVSQFMVIDDPECLGFGVDTVNNGFLPSFHIFGNAIGFHVLQTGALSVVVNGFDPATFLGSNQDYKVTFATVVPPIMVFLAKHPMVDDYDLSSLRDIFCGAAPLSQQLEDDVTTRLKNETLNIIQGYGMSEIGVGHYRSRDTCKPGSVGALAGNASCKVIDPETGDECGVGQPGELLIKSPGIMRGYYNNPKATQETMTEDGFLKTGDIGYYDEDGDFFIVDRLKELIKVKGFQVAPAELEALLLEHPLIADAAVIGIPDERAGERPKAFVVKHPTAELNEDEVISFLKTLTSSYKIPAEVEFTEVIPKLPSGKIKRNDLRASEKAKRDRKSV